MYLPILRIDFKKDQQRIFFDDGFFMPFFSDFLYKSICCAHNIYLYKEIDKKPTCCNLKTTELFGCKPIGVCVVCVVTSRKHAYITPTLI